MMAVRTPANRSRDTGVEVPRAGQSRPVGASQVWRSPWQFESGRDSARAGSPVQCPPRSPPNCCPHQCLCLQGQKSCPTVRIPAACHREEESPNTPTYPFDKIPSPSHSSSISASLRLPPFSVPLLLSTCTPLDSRTRPLTLYSSYEYSL